MVYNRKLIVKKDILIDFVATVRDYNGNVVDLSVYESVKFIMVDSDNVVKINATATFMSKTNGTVTYNFTGTDLDTVGKFKAYFVFYTGSTKKLASPPTYFDIEVTEDYL